MTTRRDILILLGAAAAAPRVVLAQSKALGIKISNEILLRADEVIE